MGVIPGGLHTDSQPPMAVPLRHFLVGLGFLFVGSVFGLAYHVGAPIGSTSLVHVHLLLVGWVCVTIMGAMTQFVPVWSGVSLYSRRLAVWQLWLVVAGLLGFAGSLSAGSLERAPLFGLLLLSGFWVFVYNVGRTLATVDRLDVTERHFAVALGFFLVLTALGVLLALDFTVSVFESIPRSNVVAAHATLAVFGAVLTTVLGALYQLGTMFTQTELRTVDRYVQRFEEIGYPVGVVALAAGRLIGSAPLATIGGLLVPLSLAGIAFVLARKLLEMRVPPTPMHYRYAVLAAAMGLWAVSTVPVWVTDPLAPTAVFGGPGAHHLLGVGVIGFAVFGTLYHVFPFLVWVHRYSDRLGFEDVPMVDDLYDDRIATADSVLLVSGTAVMAGAEWFGSPAFTVGAALVTAGVCLFLTNMILVVHRHSGRSFPAILIGPVGLPNDDGPPRPDAGE